VEELCRAAFEAGLSAVAMTEHYDYAQRGGTEHYTARAQQRVREVAEAKERWAGKLEVLCGIELGQPHLDPAVSRQFANSGQFDVVISSLHDLRLGRDLYRDFAYATAEECDAVYKAFFNEARELVRNCDVDVFGHYDYPLRLMDKAGVAPNMERWKEHMLPFLKDLAQSGIALELNTVGLRRWMGRPAGEGWILQAFRAFGGSRISIGSDAHHTYHVGAGVRETCAILRENGFDSVTIYRQRKPVQRSI
jgi:histidinol-phosphatase (PHP family)